jgi:Putative FMN-binding domain
VLDQPNLNIKVDRDRAARYGLNVNDVNTVVQAALGGAVATTLLGSEAFPWNDAPRYLIHNRDGIYGAAVTHRLRAMGIRDKPRGSLGLYASHLPTVLKDEGPYGLIECHLARANPHWKDLAAGTEALMIFPIGPARACLDRCDCAPDGGVDRAANYWDPRVTLRQIGMRPRLCMERWFRLGIMPSCTPVAVPK